MNFDELGLSSKVLSAARNAGYDTPTPIQQRAIPIALTGRDIIGIAQTGTGKTGAFILPILNKLEKGRTRARMPRVLIIEPTRELAAQVVDSLNSLGSEHKVTIALLIGGTSFDEQNRKLDRGVDVVIATPGRFLDHIERGKILLTGIELLVIDEADRMLDMGFVPDVERICKQLPFTRQTLFFSATMPPEIQQLVSTFLHNPERIEVARPSSTATTVDQSLVHAPGEQKNKRALLRKLIAEAEELKNAIIFCNRKRDVATLLRSLQRHGFKAGSLHGDMDQHNRMITLEQFRNREIPLLVASDIAARGLDISDVSHVFNFNVPTVAEDYVHRIGRTGRAGRVGTAVTLVTPDESKYLNAIENLIQNKLTWRNDAASPADANAEETSQNETRGETQNGRKRRAQKKEAHTPVAPAKKQANQRTRKVAASHSLDPSLPTVESEKVTCDKDAPAKKQKPAPVIGFGNHIPAFLLQSAYIKHK